MKRPSNLSMVNLFLELGNPLNRDVVDYSYYRSVKKIMDAAFDFLAHVFKVNSLKDFQKECFQLLLDGTDVFVSYKTGSGKSACYECYPL